MPKIKLYLIQKRYEQRYGPSAYVDRVVAPVQGFHPFETYVEPSRKYAGKTTIDY